MGIEEFLLQRATLEGEKRGEKRGEKIGKQKRIELGVCNAYKKELSISTISEIFNISIENVKTILQKNKLL